MPNPRIGGLGLELRKGGGKWRRGEARGEGEGMLQTVSLLIRVFGGIRNKTNPLALA